MAKDVVFESERFEKRQSIKRWLFPIVGILIIAAAAVAVTLLLQGRGRVISGGEDSAYPYTWTVNKGGTVTLELDRSAAPGYVWQAEAGATAVTGRESGEGKDRFTLTPQREGRLKLRFTLLRAEDETDRVFELIFLAEAEEQKGELSLTPVSAVGRPIQGTVRGGEDAGLAYTIRTDEDGDLVITVPLAPAAEAEAEVEEKAWADMTDEERQGAMDEAYAAMMAEVEDESDWDCSSGNEEIAIPMGVIYGDDGVAAYFRPGTEAGTVTLRMTDAFSGACITAECENSPGGSLTVLSHGVSFG